MIVKHFVIFVVISSTAQSLTIPGSSDEDFDDHQHPHGNPVNLMWLTQNQSIEVDYDSIDKMFLHPEIADRTIVAISIIGAFRKGKSFLMDYCLRFMYANYKSINFMDNNLKNRHDWVGDEDAPLTGFSWKSGPTRHTTGVVIWSDVFLHEVKGEKLAIVLFDTQGLFDTQTSAADNSRIFALGTLISSVQIFNLNDVLQENQLEYLQMATDYAKFANSNSFKKKNKKPFQHLIFLMRDWAHVNDQNYGSIGGTNYLNKVLEIKSDQSPQLKVVRQYIQSSFEKVSCFLMPHPGLAVTTDNLFDGRFSSLSEDFQGSLLDFTRFLLDPKSLTKKRILDKEVNGRAYSEYVKTYFRTFQSPETPSIPSLYEATIESQFANSVNRAFSFYKEAIENGTDFNKTNYIELIEPNHTQSRELAVNLYKATKKMGTQEHDQKFLQVLEKNIDSYYEQWKANVVKTYNEMIEVAKENERKIEEIKAASDAKIKEESERQEAEKKQLQDQMAENLKRIEDDSKLIQEEKDKEIAKIKAENEKTQQENEEKFARIIEQQKTESENLRKVTTEITEKAAEEIRRLQQDQANRQKEIETKVLAEQQHRMEILKMEADERREQRRIEQARIDREDADRKQELIALRHKNDEDAKERRERLEREEVRRQEEKREREEQRKQDLEERKEERKQQELERQRQQKNFELQLEQMRQQNSQPQSQSSPTFCVLVICWG